MQGGPLGRGSTGSGSDREKAIERLAPACVKAEKDFGIPGELSLGQALLESGNLKSSPGNNLHGIKYVPSRHSGKQLLTTREWMSPAGAQAWVNKIPGREIVRETGATSGERREYVVKDWFAAYDSLEDSIRDHAKLISLGAPYRAAFEKYQQDRDLNAMIDSVGKVYATSPIYAKTLKAIITPDLIAACEKERAKS